LSASVAAPIEIRVPDLGGFADVAVIDVLVKEGDAIEVDTPLITLETEKATMDVPSTAAGRVTAVNVKKGSTVSQGSVIVLLEPAAGEGVGVETAVRRPSLAVGDSEPTVRQPRPAPAAAPASQPAPPPATPPPARATQPEPIASERTADGASSVVSVDFSSAYASPSVRKFARELGVDLTRVQGSGPKGRITHDDVKAWVKRVLTEGMPTGAGAALPKVPLVDFAKFGPIEVKPLSRIQKISGPRLHASWVNIPHVTQFDEADITDLEEARVRLKGKAIKEGIKLTPLAFVLKACVKTIAEFPQFNTSLDASGENLVQKKYLHMGFAADTPNGLVVPVIRDIDRKDIYEIARDLGELSAKARDGKLTAIDMQGGCFTVSSLGGIGGTAFTPIINAPEVAILGVSRSTHRPVYENGSFVPRLILPLSLSYDHRVIDGALAVRFTTHLAKMLTDVRGLVEAIP
jgi:pyruvate dehydrogenase E2 component (dihydrolipoamide acetyltransferase)